MMPIRLVMIGVVGTLLGCGSNYSQKKLDVNYLNQVFMSGRRVHHGARMFEDRGFNLQQDTYVETQAIENNHDPSVPGLLRFDTRQSLATKIDEVQEFSLAWLREHARELGCEPDELRPAENTIQWLSDRVLTLHFDRYFEQTAVRDAFVQINFAIQDDGFLRLREIVNRSHGSIVIDNPNAEQTSSAEIDKLLESVNLIQQSAREVIYPMIDADHKFKMYRATEVTAWDEEEQTTVTLTIAHGSLEPIEAFRHRYHAKFAIKAEILDRSYLDTGRLILPLSHALVGNTNIPTDGDGVFESDIAGGNPVSVRLTGPRATSILTGQNMPFVVSGEVNSSNGSIRIEPDANGLIALNAFMSIQRVNAFTRRHLRENEAGILNRNIRITSNVNGSCNAFYDGSISLFAAGQQCANMALVNDVAYHEWGHALDDSVGRSRGITDGAFSEGIGDILAAYYSDSSAMGVGFLQGNSGGIRQLDNNLRYPDNRGGVHQEGLTIGGAFWDLRKGLIERYGPIRGGFLAEKLFFRHLLVTDSYLESFQSVMTLDDDDGNPVTPSPNRCLIIEAFAKHGLATVEPNCEDIVPEYQNVPTDTKLTLSVLRPSNNGFLLVAAASTKVSQLYACIGTEPDCLTAQRRDVTFKIDGKLGDKIVFVSSVTVTPAEQQAYTLFSLDSSGNLLGKRSFMFHSK